MSQPVARTMRMLEFVSERRRSLDEIAGHCGIHKSTALRMLQTLERGRYVRHLPEGGYEIGFGLVAIGQRALGQLDVRRVARPHLRRLVDRFGHTVHLGQLADDGVIYVDKVDGHGTVSVGSRVGQPAESHTASVAKIILGHRRDDELDALLSRSALPRHTATTVTSRRSLIAELRTARDRGWAEDDGEHEEFVNCVAVPVRRADGEVVFGLSIAALRFSATLPQLRRTVLPELRRTAALISSELGWRAPDAAGDARDDAGGPDATA